MAARVHLHLVEQQDHRWCEEQENQQKLLLLRRQVALSLLQAPQADQQQEET